MRERKKRCTGCNASKALSEFYFSSTRAAHVSQCKSCACATQAGYRNRDRAKYNAYAAAFMFKYNLERLYGISAEQYEAMLKKQRSRCAICCCRFAKTGKRPHIDHCHDTGVFRGLLCCSCNRGLGYLKDDVQLLKKALRYLLRQF